VRTIEIALFGLAAAILAVPAFVAGSPGFGLVALLAFALTCITRRIVHAPRFANSFLGLHLFLAAASLFIGVPAGCAAAALTLCLFAWNATHRFAQVEAASASIESIRSLVTGFLLRAVPASLGLGAALAFLPLIRLRLSFAAALALSVGAFILVAVLVRTLVRRSAGAQ